MTKKDYIAIARMFSETLAEINQNRLNDDTTRSNMRTSLHWLAHRFCNHAHRDNSRFDERRFMAACEWETT